MKMKNLFLTFVLQLFILNPFIGQTFEKSETVESTLFRNVILTQVQPVGFIPKEEYSNLMKKEGAIGLRIYNIPTDQGIEVIVSPLDERGFDLKESYWQCSVFENKLNLIKLGGRKNAESIVSGIPNISTKFTSFYSKAMIDSLLSQDSTFNGIELYLSPTGEGLKKTHFAIPGSIDSSNVILSNRGESGFLSHKPCPSHCLSTIRNSKGEVVDVKLNSFAADPMPLSSFNGPYIRFWH